MRSFVQQGLDAACGLGDPATRWRQSQEASAPAPTEAEVDVVSPSRYLLPAASPCPSENSISSPRLTPTLLTNRSAHFQAAVLKNEDRWLAEPDVQTITALRRSERRAAKARTHGASGVSDNDDAWDDDDDDDDDEDSGDLLACFGVFDGHITSNASSHAKRTMLGALIANGADAPSSPLETSCVAAFREVESSFARSRRSLFAACLSPRLSNSAGGTTACVVLLQRRRGGRIPGYKGHHTNAGPSKVADRVDVVAANCGDSGALLVTMPHNKPSRGHGSSDDVGSSARTSSDSLHAAYDAINYEDSDSRGVSAQGVVTAMTRAVVSGEAAATTRAPSVDSKDEALGLASAAAPGSPGAPPATSKVEFKRLTREHNPDDPLEAKRMQDAGARLGRMRDRGKEVGPMRSYPGGLAVSRAIGDLGSPAVVCEPECSRVSLPKGGGRLIIASDGLWNALSDYEAAELAFEATDAEEAARDIILAAMGKRGLHDDTTVLVVDVPPPKEVLESSSSMLPPEKPATPSPATPDSPRLSPLHPLMIKRRLSVIHSAGPSPTSSSRRISGVVLPNGAPLQTIESGEATGSGRAGNRAGRHLPPPMEVPGRRYEYDVTVRRGLKFDSTPQIDEEGNDAPDTFGDRKRNRGLFACLCGGSDAADDFSDDEFANDHLLDDYDVGKLLGRGQFGSVRIAVAKHGGGGTQPTTDSRSGDEPKFAVKSVAHDGSKRSRQMVRDEVDTMMAVSGRHPNLPIVFRVYEETSGRVTHIVTEAYLGGKLLDGIGRRKRFTVGDWESVALQLLGACAFMHSVGVVHRDIKPDNVMLKRSWPEDDKRPPSIVLLDFGSATFARGGKRLELGSAGFEGTKFYAAPEVYKCRSYGAKSDVWSSGVLLMVLLTGTPPNDRLVRVWGELQKGQLPSMPKGTPGRFISFLKSLLTVDETRRSSAAASLEDHTWLLEGGLRRAERLSGGGSPDHGKFTPPHPRISKGIPPAGPPHRRLSTGDDQELEGTVHRAVFDSVRTEYERAATFILSVVLDPKQTRTLVEQLRLGGVEDSDSVPANLLEATCWTIGAKEAGIQLELLRAQSFESGLQREAAAAVAEMSARLATPSGNRSPGYARSPRVSSTGTDGGDEDDDAKTGAKRLGARLIAELHNLPESPQASVRGGTAGLEAAAAAAADVSPVDVRLDSESAEGTAPPDARAETPAVPPRVFTAAAGRSTPRIGGIGGIGAGARPSSRRASFSQQDSRRTSFSFSAGDSLAVDMSRLLTIVDLHARHRKVYEAVALASSSQRTALLTPNYGDDRARLNNAEETLHQGMLASFLTKAHASVDDVSRLLSDSRGVPRRQSSLKTVANRAANRVGTGTRDDGREGTGGTGASDTPSPSRSLRRGSAWMTSNNNDSNDSNDGHPSTPRLTFKPRISQGDSSSQARAVTGPDGVTRVGGFTVSNDPDFVSPASDKAGVTDESDGRRNEREGRPLDRTASWWNEEMEGSVHNRHLALDALFKDGFVDRSRSRLALDDEASRSGRHSRASRASSVEGETINE